MVPILDRRQEIAHEEYLLLEVLYAPAPYLPSATNIPMLVIQMALLPHLHVLHIVDLREEIQRAAYLLWG